MSLQSAFDEVLEDMVCPLCGTRSIVPDGSFDYACSNPGCNYQGSLEDDLEEGEDSYD